MARIDAVSVVIDFRPLWRCPATALMMTYNRQKDPSNCNKMHQIMLEPGRLIGVRNLPAPYGPKELGNGFRKIYRPRSRFRAIRTIAGVAGRPSTVFHRTSAESSAR